MSKRTIVRMCKRTIISVSVLYFRYTNFWKNTPHFDFVKELYVVCIRFMTNIYRSDDVGLTYSSCHDRGNRCMTTCLSNFRPSFLSIILFVYFSQLSILSFLCVTTP